MMIHDGLIIGGGISGLAAAHWLGLHENPGSWQVWEAGARLGGTIGTDHVSGYSVDWGPNGFLDREPLTLRLAEEVGLKESLEPANDKSQKRFIVKGGRLHTVPLGPAGLVTTGLLGPLEKLRVFCEPFVPPRRDETDESVFDFAARRIGRAAAETFVDPMVTGIFGGLARQLSLPSCFPVMREMEIEYGGLVRAFIGRLLERRRREARKAPHGKATGGPAAPRGRLTSFRGGFDLLISRLQDRLQGVIHTDRAAARVHRSQQSWEVMDGRGKLSRARRLIVACPTFAAASMFREFDRELAAALDRIPYAPMAVVATGHRRGDISHPLDGFGLIIPRSQRYRTLGSIWTSSIFEARAPQGHVQLRTMLGGAGDPAILQLSDDELWETVRREMHPLIGIHRDPVLLRVYRWERGIPQFTLGHRERRSRIEGLAARYPDLHLVGNAYYGVGLNNCVKMAYEISREISSSR